MAYPELVKTYRYMDRDHWEGQWELIRGVPFNMSPAPSTNHQRVVGKLFIELQQQLRDAQCEVFIAPFDVRLSESDDYKNPDTVVQPDISVFCHAEQIDEKGAKGAPTLVVEVLSPATAIRDRNDKFFLYERFGVKEYWLVDVFHRTIEVYSLQQGAFHHRQVFGMDDTLISAVFSQLQIELCTIL